MAVVDGLTKARMLAIEANSVVDGDVNASGNLVLYRHDGTSIDAGHVVGSPGSSGSNGRGIVSSVINGAGHLIITYSDTTSVDVGRVEGLDAAPGSVLVTPDTTIVRTDDGRAKFANPTEADDGATKEYVDESKAIEIPSGTNLNDILTPGDYWLYSDPASGLNYPVLRSGTLEVRQSTNNSIMQRFTPRGVHHTEFYIRTKYGTNWYPWKTYTSDSGWLDWSPLLLSTGTNPTLGNTAIDGRYRVQGKTVQMRARFVIGSTFHPGTGVYMVTLPVISASTEFGALQVVFIQNGERPGYARLEGLSGNLRIQVQGESNAYTTMGASASNVTPTSGARIIFSGTYEAV